MKKILAAAFPILLSVFSYAQCDDSFFPFQEGVNFEQTSYDKKGKVQGKTLSTVLTADASSATVKNVIYDKKDDEVASGDYVIVCEDNMIKFDFSSFVPDEMVDQYGDAEMTVEGDFISVPNDLKEGQQLPDGSGTVKINMGGAAAMNITMYMTITDRIVEKKESITTTSGTFDTYKISQNTKVNMKVMGMNRETESSSASWFAKGVGMVKNENYNKNGELINYQLLTCIG